MENNKHNKEDNKVLSRSELSPGSGSMLAEARKKQQRTIEEIASELNLSVSQIRTIESDQTEGLPEPTYVRGYIRSYANLLGLDAELILNSYKNPNWQKSANLDDMPRGIGSAEMTPSPGFFTTGRVITLFVLVGIGGFLWLSGTLSDWLGDDRDVSQSPNDQAVTEQPSADQPTTQAITQESADAEQAQETPVNESTSDETASAPSNTTTQKSTGSSVTNEMVLNFSATSWVDIRDAEDNRLAYKSYTRGEELIIPIESRISVFIGNAEGVSVQYNGQPFDISGFREGVYAKFVME